MSYTLTPIRPHRRPEQTDAEFNRYSAIVLLAQANSACRLARDLDAQVITSHALRYVAHPNVAHVATSDWR